MLVFLRSVIVRSGYLVDLFSYTFSAIRLLVFIYFLRVSSVNLLLLHYAQAKINRRVFGTN